MAPLALTAPPTAFYGVYFACATESQPLLSNLITIPISKALRDLDGLRRQSVTVWRNKELTSANSKHTLDIQYYFSKKY
jgi:hypothetical protein